LLSLKIREFKKIGKKQQSTAIYIGAVVIILVRLPSSLPSSSQPPSRLLVEMQATSLTQTEINNQTRARLIVL
jgi:hypothetical protein